MEDERDLVVFEDDNGNELTMEVLDYLFYEGKEYALLAELGDGSCESCESKACEECGSRREAYVMEVVPVGDDMEEFVPVEESLAEKLIDIIENSDFDEEYDDEEFEERNKIRELKVLLIFALMILYTYLCTVIGFFFASVIFAVAFLALMGDKIWWHYAVAIVMCFIIFYCFRYLLYIHLPRIKLWLF